MTLQKRLELIGGCGDGNCIISPPKGQHTNGGCKCSRNPDKMMRVVWAYKEEMRRLSSAPVGPG